MVGYYFCYRALIQVKYYLNFITKIHFNFSFTPDMDNIPFRISQIFLKIIIFLQLIYRTCIYAVIFSMSVIIIIRS